MKAPDVKVARLGLANQSGDIVEVMILASVPDFPLLTQENYEKHLREACRRAFEYLDDRLSWYEKHTLPVSGTTDVQTG